VSVVLAVSTMTVAVAVALMVVAAAVLVVATAHRRDADAATRVASRETHRQDRGPLAHPAGRGGSAQAHAVERAAALTWRGRDPRAPAPPEAGGEPVPWVPPDPDGLGVTRRQLFNRSIVALFGLGLSGFSAATLAFLWPGSSGGFGAKIQVGKLSDIAAEIDNGQGFAYYPEARMWVTRYPEATLDKARAAYSDAELVAMEAGFVPLYQKCPHLGCRVPECTTSQWLECPCHGSQYNRVGEKRGGPAPRGMDRFAASIDGDVLTVDTGQIIQGPAIGTNTTGQEAEGPHCVTAGGEG
jgi:cytochrome b6-f complex iron-sulfur subunit